MKKKHNVNKPYRKSAKVNMPWWTILIIVLVAITIGVGRILK